MEENNNKKAVEKEEALIKEYKELLIKLHGNEEELKKPDNEEIKKVYMEETQKLFPQIQSSKALVFDSMVVRKVGFILKEKGQGMTANVINFQVEEYAQKMLQKMEVEPEGKTKRKSLVKLGKKVGVKFLRTPNLGYLYGALSSQPLERESVEKETRERKPRVKQTTQLKETNSQNIRKEDMKEEEEETAKVVERVLRALRDNYKMKGKQPLDYFQFIIDPESFSKTIENMFYVSFLVSCSETVSVEFS